MYSLVRRNCIYSITKITLSRTLTSENDDCTSNFGIFRCTNRLYPYDSCSIMSLMSLLDICLTNASRECLLAGKITIIENSSPCRKYQIIIIILHYQRQIQDCNTSYGISTHMPRAPLPHSNSLLRIISTFFIYVTNFSSRSLL